jgi:hypothetical protein
MRFLRLLPVCGVAAWVFVGVALGQELKTADAPPKDPNSTPGTFRAYIVLDQRTSLPKDPDAKEPPADPKAAKELVKAVEGKRNVTGFQHDLIVANELNPTVVVFSRSAKPDESVGKLVGKMKELNATYKTLDFGGYLFFPVLDKVYADDPKSKPTADELRKWGEGLPAGTVVIGLSEKESEQTKAWKLPETGVTVIFYHRHKVVWRKDLADGVVPDAALAELADAAAKELKK